MQTEKRTRPPVLTGWRWLQVSRRKEREKEETETSEQLSLCRLLLLQVASSLLERCSRQRLADDHCGIDYASNYYVCMRRTAILLAVEKVNGRLRRRYSISSTLPLHPLIAITVSTYILAVGTSFLISAVTLNSENIKWR